MNLELFIAKKIHFSQKEGKRTSLPAIKIAITGIALGLAVMILSLAIIIGFKKEIRNKVIGFGSNIQITNFDRNSSFETEPIAINDSLLAMIKQFLGVRHISPFSTKPGILKTETDFQGIVLKGVDQTYDWTFFRDNLKEGELPSFDGKRASTDILMSQHMANLLKLKVGDSFLTYFVQDNVKARKFHITGIYDTGFVDYDKLFVITDIRQITSLNDWEKDEVSGYEIMIDKFDNLDLVTEGLDEALDEETDKSGNSYYVRSIKELNPEIFAWLDVLDINVVVIIILMLTVAGFTMISGLLIIILERTNMIGILKALGESNANIRKIFLYVSFFLISKGMLWGNIIGIALCLLQSRFNIVSLDPETYYLNSVPIDLNIMAWLLLNIGTLIVSMFMMLAPSYLITKIAPAKSIRFE